MAHIEGPVVQEAEIAATVLSASEEWGAAYLAVTLDSPWGTIEYLSNLSTLVVISGAGGETSALYIFSGRDGVNSLDLMATRGSDRWAAQCVASPNGREYLVWDPELALANLVAQVQHGGRGYSWIERRFGPPKLGSPAEWSDWLNLYGWLALGANPADLGTIGYRPSNWLYVHCYALRAGLARVRGAK